jgi:hypothetical protein
MKTMKKMITLIAVAGLVLALAPAAQAATVITPTGVSSTNPFSTFVPTSLLNVLDTAFHENGTFDPYVVGTPLTYDPNAAANASSPTQGIGTANTGLSYIGNNGDVWSGTIAIPAGSTLDFLDVWGTIPGGGSDHFDRSRDLVFTLFDGTNTWSSDPWNGVLYSGTNDSNEEPGYGRFDFLGAGVTDDLLLNATTFSISSTSSGQGPHLNEIRLVGSVPAIPEPGNEVPEPASIAIWTVIGLCLAGYGYRRRRRNS